MTAVDLLGIGDPLSVDGHDEIAAQQDGLIAHVGLLRAAAQAGLLSRSAGENLLDQKFRSQRPDPSARQIGPIA